MQKLSLLLAAAMTATCVSAQQVQFHLPQVSEQAKTEGIQYFLSTEVGKHFTEQQVREAMQQPQQAQQVNAAASENVVVLVHESFDKWTAGSNDAPDATIIDAENQEAVDALFETPGWTAFLCSQAGGAAYESFDEVGEDGPGYLMTPDMDITQNQGVVRFITRVKNVNENATDYNLQYYVLDNNPEKPGIISANVLPMQYGEYTTVDFICHADTKYLTIMFFSWKGKVLVDEVEVQDVIYALDTPSNIQVQATSGTSIKVSCDPIQGATQYTFTAFSRKNSEDAITVTSAQPEAIIEGYFDASEDVIVYVTASNDSGDQSYMGAGYGPIAYTGTVETPMAMPATNVTNAGFTANWEASTWSNSYELSLVRTHTVGEGGELVYYMNEDFSEVTLSADDPSSTIMTSDGQPISLNPYINAQGWNVYLASVSTGMLALTNMYEAYGFPGMMVSDPMNFSYGGGKINVSGMAVSYVDDIVMKVGFAEVSQSLFGTSYTFLDGAKEFEITTAGCMFDVEIEGGTDYSILLLQMVDASPSGDMAIFLNLNMYATAQPGDQFTGNYATVTLPGTATSYDVEVEFPAGDVFTYSVVGKFGDNISSPSDVVTVEAPGTVALDRMQVNAEINAIFTLDGRRVAAKNLSELRDGTYIVRSAKGSAKMMK